MHNFAGHKKMQMFYFWPYILHVVVDQSLDTEMSLLLVLLLHYYYKYFVIIIIVSAENSYYY